MLIHQFIETYSDRIPNDWVDYRKEIGTNAYYYWLTNLVFNQETKSLESVGGTDATKLSQKIKFLVDIGDNPQAGIITEQLTAILIHRQEEFNKKLPSEQGTKIVEHLKEVVRLTEERIEDRKNRGVHGENKL